jgi:hypothetical protein
MNVKSALNSLDLLSLLIRLLKSTTIRGPSYVHKTVSVIFVLVRRWESP